MVTKKKVDEKLEALSAPPITTLVKLGNIAVHVEEFLSPKGHEVDRLELQQLLADPEVKAWIDGMNEYALLPRKR